MTPINDSPVCKCAVPNLKQLSYRDYCQTCGGFPLPKEVKCCECFAANIQKSDYRGNVCACKCHSPNMTEVMERVDKQIGGAVRRLGSEEKVGWENANPEQKREMVIEAAHEANAAQREVMGLEAPKTEASWEEEFDEKFGVIPENVIPFSEQYSAEDFKSFIRSLLLSEKNKAREEGRNHLQNIINEFGGNAEQCLAILEEILAGKTDVEL